MLLLLKIVMLIVFITSIQSRATIDRKRNAIRMVFRLRADIGPILHAFCLSIDR